MAAKMAAVATRRIRRGLPMRTKYASSLPDSDLFPSFRTRVFNVNV